jgi:transposase
LRQSESARRERLEQIIKEMQRHRFGRRAETLPEDQLLLGFEEVEQTTASDEADHEAKSPAERAARASKRRANRGSLPSHLPRVEMVVDVQDQNCPCCGGLLHVIGEDRAERLDIIPAQFRVLVGDPKYACRACEDVMVQAPAPSRLIEGGIPTEATVAQVLVSKYADHLPLYRQAQIYARQGVNLDRSTLADWTGRAAFLLRPVHDRLLAFLKGSTKLFADETTALGTFAVEDGPIPEGSLVRVYVSLRSAGARCPWRSRTIRRHFQATASIPQPRGHSALQALIVKPGTISVRDQKRLFARMLRFKVYALFAATIGSLTVATTSLK